MNSSLLPWQRLTKDAALDLTFKIENWTPPSTLVAELLSLIEQQAPSLQAGPYHDGGWSVLALVSPNGDPQVQFPRPGDIYKPTRYMAKVPTTQAFVRSLPGDLRRVRLSRLSAGSQIHWHFDDFEQKTGEEVFRFHIPIATMPDNVQIISHDVKFWDIGELWLGDYRFPHKVVNASSADRVHLILDVAGNNRIRDMLKHHFGVRWNDMKRSSAIAAAQDMLRVWRRTRQEKHG